MDTNAFKRTPKPRIGAPHPSCPLESPGRRAGNPPLCSVLRARRHPRAFRAAAPARPSAATVTPGSLLGRPAPADPPATLPTLLPLYRRPLPPAQECRMPGASLRSFPSSDRLPPPTPPSPTAAARRRRRRRMARMSRRRSAGLQPWRPSEAMRRRQGRAREIPNPPGRPAGRRRGRRRRRRGVGGGGGEIGRAHV